MHRSFLIGRPRGAGMVVSLLLVAAGTAAGASATTPAAQEPGSLSSQAVSAAQTDTGTEFTFRRHPVELSDTFADVLVPVGTGPFPAVVTVHGGGYTGGSPAHTRPMAELLARSGFVVFNTGYALSTPTRPAFPAAIDDVACAVRLAASHPSSDGSVAVIGVSAGAHAAALVALTGDRYGSDCPDTATVKPDRLIGLGHVDITGRNTIEPPGPNPFFMQEPEDISADRWQAGDPLNHVAANPGLQALFIHAGDDEITSLAASQEMVAAMTETGVAAELLVIPGIGHFDLATTDNTGAAILEWLGQHPPA